MSKRVILLVTATTLLLLLLLSLMSSPCRAASVAVRVPSNYVGGVKWVLHHVQDDGDYDHSIHYYQQQQQRPSVVNQAAGFPPNQQRQPVNGVQTSPSRFKKVTLYKKKKEPVDDYDTEVVEGLTGVPDLVPQYEYDYQQENYYPSYDYQDIKKPPKKPVRRGSSFRVPPSAVQVSGPGYY